jgi:hypothetical protein
MNARIGATSRVPSALAALLCALLPTLAGCPPKEAPSPLGAGSLDWPFRPSSVSIHPLTRADSSGAEQSLLVMVEFRDQDGDPVKAIGRLAIEVRCANAAPTDTTFEFDLFDRATNRRLFDPVTQTYRLRLERPWTTTPGPGSTVSIAAVLEVSTQERISGEVRVPW